ncbi:MAG TPA: hypothetical protein VK569_05105 [Bacteroidota bacterium]|nr:hypothetical protein [Bacteroidota bacterium]
MSDRRLRSAVGGAILMAMIVPELLLAQTGVDDAVRISRQGLTFNARSLGMGDAYSTIGYDFTALRMNPASLGLSEGGTYTMSVNSNGFAYQSKFFGTQTNFATTNTTLSQAGFTIPFKLDSVRQAVIGLGFTQDKDFNAGAKYSGYNSGSTSFVGLLTATPNSASRSLGLTFPTYDNSGRYLGDQTVLNGNFQESGYVLDAGNLIHFSGGISLQAASGVFFGVSGSYNVGTFESDQEFTATNTRNTYADSLRTVPTDPRTAGFKDATYRDVSTTQYKGWDVRFGLVYRFFNFIGLSASFKVPFAHSIDATHYLSGTTTFGTGTILNVDQSVVTQSYTITPPYEATVGGMVNLWILTGTAEATYVDYSQMKVTGGVSYPDQSDLNKQIKDQFTRVVNLNVGAEFRLPFTGLSARAGAMYRPSPYKGDPGRYDQKFLTAGFGINSGDKLFFDIGYLYGWRDEKKSDVETAVDPTVSQTVTYQNILLSIKFVL